jgi:hypothetical protein
MITRESVEDYILIHRTKVVIAASGVLALMIVLLVIIGVHDGAKKNEAARIAAERKANAIRFEELWMPAEPLPVPDVQLFRERQSVWSADDAELWYIEPDTEMMGRLEAAAAASVESLLEKVP